MQVVVAGSKGLIGKEVVKALERRGYSVVEIDQDTEYSVHIDDTKKIFDKYEVRGFVNCAYPQYWLEHISLFINATEDFAYYMSRNGGGAIVNLSSIYGLVGPDDRIYKGTDMTMPPGYAAAKGAIIAHSRCIATKYAAKGVRVNCVAPGGVYDTQSDYFVAEYNRRVPMGRMAKSGDISSVVAFLIGSGSKYITGQTIPVDGGLSAW